MPASKACPDALAFYSRFFQERTGRRMEVVLKKRGGYADGEGFLLRTLGHLQKTLPHVPLEADRTEADNSYYLGTNFKLKLPVDGRLSEIGDGGFVDWTQKLLGNKKERLLISGIGWKYIGAALHIKIWALFFSIASPFSPWTRVFSAVRP
jgi:hypothetical protein